MTFTISYTSANATLIKIKSDGSDGYSDSSSSASGQFAAKYSCATPLAAEQYELVASASGSPSDSVKLAVTGVAKG